MNLSCIKTKTLALLACVCAFSVSDASAQTYRLPGQHTAQSQSLLANQTTTKPNTLVAPSIDYLNFEEESEPEGDIYEIGWNSNRVNCYANVQVPQRAVIDVRNFSMPHPGYLTSPYGFRKRFNRMHKGVDIHLQVGDTVRAAFDGKIRITNYEAKGYGNYVVIRHYNDLETVYGHLSKFLVKNNQYVKAGDPIALGGNTGHSTGPHLHFETRYMGYAINPAAIFDFANQTTHTDTYTFDKNTYQNARNFSPEANAAYATQYNKANPRRATATSNSNASKQQSAGNAAYATVKKGDSLGKIANRNHTTVSKLCKLNGLKSTARLTPGQKIRIR